MKLRDWDINLKVRLFGEGMTNLLFWMFFPFMSIYFSDAFGKETAGALLVASQVISVAIGLVGGYCADHLGRKKMMVIASLGQAVSFIFFALGNSPWLSSPLLTFISFSFLGLFGQLYWPASHAMVADVVPEKHRSSVFAVFYTSINITVVLGPLLGGIFFFDFRFPLLVVCFAVSVLLTFVLQKWIHETAPKVEKRTKAGKWYQYLGEQLHDYRVIITDKTFLIFILAGVLVAQTFMQLDLLMAVYTTEEVPTQSLLSLGSWHFDLTGKQAFSWVVAENGLLVALFTVLMNKWMTRYKEKTVFMGSAIFYGLGILLFGNMTNVWGLLFAVVIFTAAELMVVGIQDSFISKLAPENMRGQYFAASSLRFSIGRTIAPIAIPLTVWVGYTWTFSILGFLAFASAGLYAVMFRRLEKQKKSEPTIKIAKI
ncbi:MFS family permease [Pullulanibacillus pueri]|uniref:Multidrug resistance protein n=1 Tax=Pullulanibacillus pueri TaxID=1437324 RepID=A0A8J2ZTI5_9BACL|nr:MFS transporter [Pullulanibacillus pueri]MBM7680383.1 MFS family permease [Pullulanibacillus pueri]GGH75341.1 multidrug resistance protein [Pullulanibacillus pueri]